MFKPIGTHSVCGDQTSAGRLPRPALGNTDRAGPVTR